MPNPVSEIQLCLLSEVLPLTVKLLGIADANHPEGGSVAAGAPYTLAQIKKLIFQSDYEICLLIVENLDNPYRSKFVTEETAFLADGDLIPAHFGYHSKVTVKNGTVEELGQPRDYARIKRLRKNRAVYGSPVNLYAIFAGRIYFANPTATAMSDIPKVTKDLSLTTLLSPLPYFWAVIAGAISKAAMPGFPDTHRKYWTDYWRMYVGQIKSGAFSIPEPEQLERIGT